MTIDEQIKRVLKGGPLTSHQIAKAIKPNLTPDFKQEVRDVIKGLIADGELTSSGAGKGTYYAIAGSDAPKPTPKVLKPASAKASKAPKQRKLKPPPRNVPASARRQAPIQAKSVGPNDASESIEFQRPTAPTESVDDAVDLVIATLRIGKEYLPATIAKLAADRYGVSQLKAHGRLTDLIRANSAVLFAQWRWIDGRNLYVWRPTRDEVRPDRDDIDRSQLPKL